MPLVLSRKRRETIVIDNRITITVDDIRGDKVRLAITAPQSVTVDRLEVWEQKQRDADELARRAVAEHERRRQFEDLARANQDEGEVVG